MIIIGADYHPSDHYIAFVDTETGEDDERRLNHGDGEAEKFYRDLQPSFWCLISRAIGNLKFTLTITAFIRR